MTWRPARTPPKIGQLIRVVYHENPKSRDMWLEKIAEVRAIYGFRVTARRIIGARPGIEGEIKWEHMIPISEDDIRESEWPAYAAWRLTNDR